MLTIDVQRPEKLKQPTKYLIINQDWGIQEKIFNRLNINKNNSEKSI